VKRALAAAACALVVVGPAHGATSRQVRALAQQAATSPRALERLRAIRSVDGRPLDLGRVLHPTNRAELEARLRALAAPSAREQSFPARAEARRILRGRRFHGSPVPRPFHGALAWLGGKLQPVVRLLDWLAAHLPGGHWTLWALLALIVIVLSGLTAGRAARRRGGLALERAVLGTGRSRGVDPRDLERAADEAEARGDPASALRLRFRAGLLRLGRAQVLPLRESLTSGEARRIIRLPEFDGLARTHDEVVYGGRPAEREDAVAARERWPLVLEAKGVRA
jgi:hypothetical protein